MNVALTKLDIMTIRSLALKGEAEAEDKVKFYNTDEGTPFRMLWQSQARCCKRVLDALPPVESLR